MAFGTRFLGGVVRASALFALVAMLGLASFVGCGSSEATDDANTDNTGPVNTARGSADAETRYSGDLPSASWARDRYYDAALRLMNEKERVGFFDLANDYDRDQYLRLKGVDVRVDLTNLLTSGGQLIDRDTLVERMQPYTLETQPAYFGRTETFLYRWFAGQGYTLIFINVYEGTVTNWGSYLEPDWQREQYILEQCAKIRKTMSLVVEEGEAMDVIASKYASYKKVYDDAVAALGGYYIQPLDRPDDAFIPNEGSRIGWQDEVELGVFEENLWHLELLSREPDRKDVRGNRVTWVWTYPFGKRTIEYTITFMHRRVVDFNAEPVPEANRGF